MSEIFAITERQVSEICEVPEKVHVSKYCLVSGKCYQILSIFILGSIACTICFLVLVLPCFFDGCTNDLVEAGDFKNHAESSISGKIFFSKSHNRSLIIKEWRLEAFREQQFFIMGTSKMPYNYSMPIYNMSGSSNILPYPCEDAHYEFDDSKAPPIPRENYIKDIRLTLPSKLTNCDIKWLAVVSRAWHPEEHYFGEILADITFDSPDIIAFKHKNCGCGLVDDKPPFPCLIG